MMPCRRIGLVLAILVALLGVTSLGAGGAALVTARPVSLARVYMVTEVQDGLP
ncbi:MAG: hypothetical protein M3Y74_22020 [Chloroflexota bacterium]|nr:hypothetical protein [Chloroflexota bacterium]